MEQIKCPHCGEVFTIDESHYESIVKQIKDAEFLKELAKKEADFNEKLNLEKQLIHERLSSENNTLLSNKEKEIDELKHKLSILDSDYSTKLSLELAKNKELINQLNNELNTVKLQKEEELKTQEALKSKELADLRNELRLNQEKAKAESEILKKQIENKENEKALEIEKALSKVRSEKDGEVSKIRQEYESLRVESSAKIESLRNNYEQKLIVKDKELADTKTLVDYYKDLKTRMSTKMIGETLEQHCANEFNRNRMAMFPNAYFEKDNDASSGSKGDFIYRDYDGDKTEIISIMFEMKNEADTTATKHKNEDFFKELDKDRREKKCEYAVLVSLLESDNDLYNEGIVDVSYRYPKMYVIRPQFFIPIITLLRNASMNALTYKKQLIVERNNNLDVTNFEKNMEDFKLAFGKNYETASKKFNVAIEEIDKTIEHLKKVKDNLLSSDRQLRLANDKAQDLSIKKLTKNAPSVAKKFEEIKEDND